MTRSRPLAVLFDLDGTLVDSSKAHGFAYHRAFMEYGLEVAPDAFARFEGQSHLEVMAGLKAGRRLEVADEVIHLRKTELFADELHRVEPLPLLGLVATLRSRVPIGLVTSAKRRTASDALRANVTLEAFDVVVAAGEAAASKPDPAPYIEACDRLGVLPEGVIAFEDSPAGLQSAQAAGVQVVPVVAPGAARGLGSGG